MSRRSIGGRWAHVAVLALTLLALPGTGARDAAAQSADAALDLAAMTLLPTDVEGDYGLAGSYFTSLEDQAAFINDQRGGDDEALDDLIAVLTDAGYRRYYLSTLAAPDTENPGFFATAVYSYVFEYAEADGAAAGFTELENEEGIADSEDVPGSETFGDQSEITRSGGTSDGGGDPYQALDLTFQLGNLVGGVTLIDFTGNEPEVTFVESLAETLQAKIEAVRDSDEGDGLSNQILRFAEDGIDTFYDHYERLGGETFRYFDEGDTDFAFRDQSDADSGFVDIYYLSQAIGPDGAASDDYVLFSVRVDRFASEDEASTWIQETPAAFVASPGVYEDVAVVADLAPVGDELAAVEYRITRPSGVAVTGYAIYIRVGAVVATVQVDAPSEVPLATVEALAAAQADCLAAGACLDPAPLPADLLGPAPEEPGPMNQADRLRDLLDDLD